MCAGGVIHSMGDSQNIRFVGGLSLYIPFTSSSLIVSDFALCYMPLVKSLPTRREGWGGETGTNYGGSGPVYVVHVLVFLDNNNNNIITIVYQLSPSDKAQFTLQLRVSLTDLV